MKILIVASDKGGKFVPFIEEQIVALQQAGIEIVRYAVTGKGILGYLRELPALRRMIRAERPDIIHAHYGLCGLLANLQRLVPVVTTYHGSDINLPNILRLSKIAICLSAYNIFVSKRNVSIALSPRSLIVSRLKKRCALLPCGINLTNDQLTSPSEARKALGIADDAKIVLFAGALDNAVKDPELAKAAVMEANHIISLPLEDVDSSGMLSKLSSNNNTPRELELKELKGFSRMQVNQLMCAADALLMTSKTEGSPQVIKEAMACGCPIVSVDVGDVAERTSGVEGCYIVPNRDPKDIAQAILQAITYGGRTNGRQRIIDMGLSNDLVAKSLVELYNTITPKNK